MSTINVFRALISERLTAAAEEILGAFEKTMVAYEEEIDRQRRLLDRVSKPKITLHNIVYVRLSDQQHRDQERNPSICQEDPESTPIKVEEELDISPQEDQLPSQEAADASESRYTPSIDGNDHDFLQPLDQHCEQDRSTSLGQEDPESHNIKEEEELGISPQEDQLPLQELADTSECICMPLCDGNGHDKNQPLPLLRYQTQTEVDTEPPAVNSYELTQTDDKEDNLVISEPTNDHHTLSNCCHVTESEADHTYCRHICEEEIARHRSTLDIKEVVDQQKSMVDIVLEPQHPKPPHIKEEQQEVLISQQEDGLQLQEKADLSQFTLCDGSGLSKDQSLPLHPYPTRSITKATAGTSSELKQSDANEDAFPISEPISYCQPLSQNCRAATISRCKQAALTQNARLKRHKRHKKLHNCPSCGKECTNTTNLKCHIRTHTGEKPFRCTTCGKMFTQNSHLQKHIRTHTGERRFRCNTCWKMFFQKAHLQRHIWTHTGERPFRCQVCKKGFISNWNLKQHVTVHTDESPLQKVHQLFILQKSP